MSLIRRNSEFIDICKKMMLQGMWITDIAKHLNCHRDTVSCAVGKDFLKHIKSFRKSNEFALLILSKNHKINSNTGCKEWTGPLDMYDYGMIGFRGSAWRVHRLSYFLHYGPFDKNKNICHSCDNPRCFNPEHLFIGTIQDNILDKCKKGRAPAKLTHAQALEIRHLRCQEGYSLKKLSEMYSVSVSTISLIGLGKIFKYL